MAKNYTKNTWTDEVLAAAERYEIADNTGTPIESNVQINLTTSVAVAGTEVDAAKMNNLENGVDGIDTLLSNAGLNNVAALTIANDDVLQRKSGAWTNRTIANLASDLQSSLKIYFDTLYSTLASMSAARAADLILVRDWFQTWATHFDADPSWTWMNDPTGTNGTKTFGNSIFRIQADDTLAKCFYYQTGNFSGKTIMLMGQISYNCESGIRIDDGTDNNYWELYLEYESAGKTRVYQRVRTGGGSPTETALITGLPTEKMGLLLAHGGTIAYLYFAIENIAAATFISAFTEISPTSSWRYGIFATKFDAGGSRSAFWDAWSIV